MSNNSNISKVKLYGQTNSAEAYEIRDFLKRSVVEFDWIELTCDEDCYRELGFTSLEAAILILAKMGI
jgi:thioredoxin reductase (NADPH)